MDAHTHQRISEAKANIEESRAILDRLSKASVEIEFQLLNSYAAICQRRAKLPTLPTHAMQDTDVGELPR